MPVYNGANYLAQTLDCWLRQDYSEFRMLVSDNASTDATPDILADYQRRDSRIVVKRRESTVGAAENFNGLPLEADTPYFGWSAHDDLREPAFLGKLVAVLDKHPHAVLAYTRVHLLKEGEDPAERRTYYEVDPPGTERSGLGRAIGALRRARSWGLVYGLMRLPAVVRTHLFHTPMGLVADVGFVLELATLGSFVCVPEVLLRLRIHAQNMTATNADPMFDDGRGRRLDAEARAFIETFPLSQSEKKLLLREVMVWCRKGKPRPIWMKIPGARWSYVHGSRRLIDLMGKVRGV